jgi:Fe-S cluster assembly iron-binding protein IscA
MIRLKILGNIITILTLTFSTGVFAYLYFSKEKPQVSTIVITDKGTRILTPSDINIREQETINFLKTFSSLYFNYDSSNVTEKIGEGSGFLTTNLWNDQEEEKYLEILKLSKNIKLSEVGRLIKIHSPDDDKFKYTLHFQTKISKNGKTDSFTTKVDLRLVEVERSENSIWGLKIDELNRSI